VFGGVFFESIVFTVVRLKVEGDELCHFLSFFTAHHASMAAFTWAFV
jgi:hypothetical protein